MQGCDFSWVWAVWKCPQEASFGPHVRLFYAVSSLMPSVLPLAEGSVLWFCVAVVEPVWLSRFAKFYPCLNEEPVRVDMASMASGMEFQSAASGDIAGPMRRVYRNYPVFWGFVVSGGKFFRLFLLSMRVLLASACFCSWRPLPW